MSRKADKNKKVENSIEELENDFQLFFNECFASGLSKTEINKVLWPVKLKLWKTRAIVCSLKFGPLLLMLWLSYNVEFINWNASAIGRLTLGTLRPIWDWENLYKAKCLITKQKKEEKAIDEPENIIKFNEKDCVLCENIDKIYRVSNMTYNVLYDKYLLRGRPVIITDSHDFWPTHINFASYLLTLKGLVQSEPCNLQSNLMLEEFTDIKVLLQLIEDNIENAGDEWFVHWRNCDFEAIKSVRSVAEKPYYYSPHLEPPYTSWILMSQNYRSSELKELMLLEFVIVRQLIGVLDIVLDAKDECSKLCEKHQIQLEDGEALVYYSKLWNFNYVPSDRDLSVTVVTETHLL